MIVKYFELKKKNLNNFRYYLLYGNNKGLIEVKFTVKDGDKILKQKIFSESFDYNNIENKYDLSVYQTDVEDNLINKIVEDLIIYMNIK